MADRLMFAGAGDIVFDREDPDSALRYVGQIFRDADVAYANMEQILSDEGVPSGRQTMTKGAKYVQPYVDYNFDVVSCATNHTLDWGLQGLLGTFETLEKAGVPFCGAGRNLAEARKPVILERKGVKFGMINWCSVARDSADASEDTPGIAPIKCYTLYEQDDYQPGTPARIVSFVKRETMKMIIEDIKTLREQVDVLVCAFHWGQHLIPSVIPQYCIELAHDCIDAGADLVIGAHTHILKGCEVYKEKTIYYSTGNFILDFVPTSEADLRAFAEQDRKYGLGPNARKEGDMSMIATAYIEDGKIVQTGFIPVQIIDLDPTPVKRGGQGDVIKAYMEKITADVGFSTKFEWVSDDEIRILPGE